MVTSNARYKTIKVCLKDNEMEMLVFMKFPVCIAPLFEQYLKVFQSEGPLVHLMFTELKSLLTTLLKRFVISAVVDEAKEAKQLIDIDVEDTANILDLSKIDFGLEVKAKLMKISDEKKRKGCLQCTLELPSICKLNFRYGPSFFET